MSRSITPPRRSAASRADLLCARFREVLRQRDELLADVEAGQRGASRELAELDHLLASYAQRQRGARALDAWLAKDRPRLTWLAAEAVEDLLGRLKLERTTVGHLQRRARRDFRYARERLLVLGLEADALAAVLDNTDVQATLKVSGTREAAVRVLAKMQLASAATIWRWLAAFADAETKHQKWSSARARRLPSRE